MSVAIALNNAISGITAAQSALSVVSQNVANANTEGYSKKQVNQSSVVLGGTLNGVAVDDVTRLVNKFLNTELTDTVSEVRKSVAISEFYQITQSLFGTPGSDATISNDVSDLMNSVEALANRPEDAALRFEVAAMARNLANTISRTAQDVQDLRFQADIELKASVDRANESLVRIESLNDQIARGQMLGEPTGDLEDKRDLQIRKLAEEVDVRTFQRSDGKLAVFTRNGVDLVDDKRRELGYDPIATVDANTTFNELLVFNLDTAGQRVGNGEPLVTSGVSANVTTTIRSGRISGLLEARDSVTADLQNQLDTLASTVRDQTNAVHNLGSGVPAPNTLTGTRALTGTDAFQSTGTVRIAVTNAAGTVVDVTDLDLGALGATTVNGVISAVNTALSGNAVAQVTDGTLVINATDSANGISINAAGTAESVTDRNFSHYFGLNDMFTGTAAVDFALRGDIESDPSRISTALLSTTAAIGETALTSGDNRSIQAFAALSTTEFSFVAVGGLPAVSATFGNFAGSIVGLNAARAADAESLQEHHELIFENLDIRFRSETGVNVDEEMAEMVLYQNAFTVSARVFTVASEMFDTLVNLGR